MKSFRSAKGEVHNHNASPIDHTGCLIERQRFLIPLALFLLFWPLYLLTLRHQYTYDGLCFALDVEFGTPAQFFHANHLVYGWLCRFFYHLSQGLGYSGRAIYLMQSLNALLGAIAVALLGRTIAQRYGIARGMVAAGLFGVSNAFWMETTDPGNYALSALGTCLLLELLLRLDDLDAFAVGLAHGVIVLFHQMLILIAPAYALRLWTGQRRSWKTVGSYFAGLAVGAGLPYGMVAALYHRESLGEAVYWAFGPAGPRPGTKILSRAWWSTDLASNAVNAWNGFAKSMVVGGLLWQIVLAAALIAVGIWSYRHVTRKSFQGKDLASLWTWILVLNLFQFFFYPGALRYRILFMPPLLFVGAAASMDLRDKRWAIVAGTFAAGVLALNYVRSIQPNRPPGADFFRTEWVKGEVRAPDFFLFGGQGQDSILNVYFAYFAKEIPARSLFGYLFSHPQGQMDDLTAALLSVRQAGGRIVFEQALLDPARQRALEFQQKMPEGTVQRWVRRWRPLAAKSGPAGYAIVQMTPDFQAR